MFLFHFLVGALSVSRRIIAEALQKYVAGELSADPETPASLVSPSRKRVSKMKTDKQKDER